MPTLASLASSGIDNRRKANAKTFLSLFSFNFRSLFQHSEIRKTRKTETLSVFFELLS